jgi:hypothetical protein
MAAYPAYPLEAGEYADLSRVFDVHQAPRGEQFDTGQDPGTEQHDGGNHSWKSRSN